MNGLDENPPFYFCDLTDKRDFATHVRYSVMGSKVQGSLFKVDLTHLFLKFSYETFQKLELVLIWTTLHFVGWVEPIPGFVGFRCTQPPQPAFYLCYCELRNPTTADFRTEPQKFLFRLNWLLFKSAAALNPEPLNPEPLNGYICIYAV